jgi:hypothetical protein
MIEYQGGWLAREKKKERKKKKKDNATHDYPNGLRDRFDWEPPLFRMGHCRFHCVVICVCHGMLNQLIEKEWTQAAFKC